SLARFPTFSQFRCRNRAPPRIDSSLDLQIGRHSSLATQFPRRTFGLRPRTTERVRAHLQAASSSCDSSPRPGRKTSSHFGKLTPSNPQLLWLQRLTPIALRIVWQKSISRITQTIPRSLDSPLEFVPTLAPGNGHSRPH